MKKITRDHLKDKNLWKPVYGRFDKSVVLKRIEALKNAGINVDAIEKTKNFIELAFDDFYRHRPPRRYGFVFAIPSRIDRHSSTDISEARSFLPFVDYVAPEVAQIFMTELPPCVLDEYFDNNGIAVGAIVYVPLLADIRKDIWFPLLTLRKVNKIINISALYIKNQLQPSIVGLGATLPKITGFGKDFRKHGLVTTSGHGGTVFLIYKMYAAISAMGAHYDHKQHIGIIGAGSIGAATADLLLSRYPDMTIAIYDIRPKVLSQVVIELNAKYDNRVVAAGSNEEVLRTASVIISAITSHISVPEELDLSGTIIIDDSQPGSFSRDEVERHGGVLVWVVGTSHANAVRRHSDFRFGDNGLATSSDLWGCEAEVSTIWQKQAFDYTINAPVTPKAVMGVGKLLENNGIGIAEWQSFGVPVKIRRNKE